MSRRDEPGHRMALIAPGAWWTYDGHGSVERDGQEAALHGTVRVSIEERIAGGRPRLAIVFAPRWRRVGVDGPEGVLPMPDGLFYFEQDPQTRDVAISGDNMGPGGADRFARVPQVFYPGHFDADTRYDNLLDFGTGAEVANALRVVGIEAVETALGVHAAWKAPISSASALFGRIEGCDHWRPGLGAPLRFEMVAHGPDGSRLSTVAVLSATNHALG